MGSASLTPASESCQQEGVGSEMRMSPPGPSPSTTIPSVRIDNSTGTRETKASCTNTRTARVISIASRCDLVPVAARIADHRLAHGGASSITRTLLTIMSKAPLVAVVSSTLRSFCFVFGSSSLGGKAFYRPRSVDGAVMRPPSICDVTQPVVESAGPALPEFPFGRR